jgi:serine carboxypeptidase-like clade 1
LKSYPSYIKNDFYIAGESYAGVYVPFLAQQVMDGILNGSFLLPFKGILVGNGVSNAAGCLVSTI